MTLEEMKKNFCKIKGKTIALVYTFEGDASDGFEHFFIWKSKILSKWMIAIEELHCLPLIIDVRTFIDKAINRTLPQIDFVLNMNTGILDLSVMALVPSMCSSLNVPCIPCNAVSIVTGENKRLSNLIAQSLGINVPKNIIGKNSNSGIFRPINLGNSLGVKRGIPTDTCNGIFQEFISGYEITTPAVYNSITGKMDLLPTVMYLPNDKNLNWFNGEEAKKKRNEYSFKIVNLQDKLKNKYLDLINTLSVQTFCRIDARVKCSEEIFYKESCNMVLDKDTYFIEINVMPTIRDTNNFAFSFQSVKEDDTLFSSIAAHREVFEHSDVYSFLLASSMLSYIK